MMETRITKLYLKNIPGCNSIRRILDPADFLIHPNNPSSYIICAIIVFLTLSLGKGIFTVECVKYLAYITAMYLLKTKECLYGHSRKNEAFA